MNAARRLPDPVERSIRWPLRLTRAGLVAERITRAFWPVWTLAFAAIAAVGLGFQDWAGLELFWTAALALPLGLVWALARGVRRFRWPSRDEALARLDATLPGRPLATLADEQAIGGEDAGSQAVWRAHLGRMAARARGARAVEPDLRLSARDPLALRYAALSLFLIAAAFGSLWKVADLGRPAAGQSPAALAATWEGWAEPPAYTGRPSLYLSALNAGALELPQGSRITIRLYGPADTLGVEQTVGDAAPPPPAPATADSTAPGPILHDFLATRSGRIAITGEGGRDWQVTVLPDAPPAVTLTGPMERMADGSMRQPFEATDDYGITSGEARFELDLTALDRRYGLAPDPEPQPPLVFDLPRPLTGQRDLIREVLTDDASEHPWANLPVRMVLTVTDGAGQTASSAPLTIDLPGRRFFDPLASAVIEMRRDLLWSRANATRTAQILRAITHRPEQFIRNERAYLMLRVAIRRLEAGAAQGLLAPSLRDEVARALWDAALLIEDGGLEDARERMRQAQERLSEAIRNGASKDEIAKLMDELREATDDYLRMLAERDEQDPAERFTKNQPTQNITQDQIQQMMDEIQRLMEEGRMAEAQALLDQLNQLMENLRVTQSRGGEGEDGQGGQSMRDLRETLRRQQDLSDDAFRQHQRQFSQGGSDGQDSPRAEGRDQPSPGEDGQSGSPSPGQTPDKGDGASSLADRQHALREELRRQQGALPDAQGQDAERARRALEQAGRAMEDAEQALRDGNTPKAIDRQAEAIENLREGMRGLNDLLAGDPNRMPSADGQAQADGDRERPRDPLGRQDGANGSFNDAGSNLLQGRDVYRRARDLLDEIRRRAADQSRPKAERDYFDRLLDRF